MSIFPHPSLSICLSTSSIHGKYFLNATFLRMTLRPLRSDHSSYHSFTPTAPHSCTKVLVVHEPARFLFNTRFFLSRCLLFCCSLGLNSIHPSRSSSGTLCSTLHPWFSRLNFWASQHLRVILVLHTVLQGLLWSLHLTLNFSRRGTSFLYHCIFHITQCLANATWTFFLRNQ